MSPKKTFDDIIPPSRDTGPKRSIRDIPIRERKPNKIDELLEETAEMRSEHHTPPPTYTPSMRKPVSKKSGSKIPLILGILILILGLGVASQMFIFNGAKVNITLKTESFPIEIAATSTEGSSAATGTLVYKVLPVQKEGTKEVPAVGAATKVEKKASGIITIYNKFSSAPQKLIATTRFETPEGLVFKLDEAVTVPGNGSVDGKVTAENVGSEYNVSMKDFTVPGFKGTPKFDGFYGRSKTAMTGGFSGMIPKIEDADLAAANAMLEKSLIDQAVVDIAKQLTANQIFFKNGGVRTTYTTSVESGTDGKAMVKGKVVAEALVYEKADILKLIADTKNGQLYEYDNLDSLAVTFNNKNPIISYISGPVLLLKLAGTLTTGQSFDENALRLALSGKAKEQMPEILQMYPEITEANAIIRPFWSSSFPENANKITLNITK